MIQSEPEWGVNENKQTYDEKTKKQTNTETHRHGDNHKQILTVGYLETLNKVINLIGED